ncbi:MAG: thiamine pyrophosphate-dependent dehydrogenase E1 component subunit alpha [Hyphomicrobiales bacterium]|nr:thiamine pyrophosphate-dependent dehydrogenase E1 component subunit alpha [Hyphomicrobiales bacterium]
MMLIRSFEERVRRLFAGGLLPGLVHLCSGQEAVAVGVCSVLRRSDVIASNHRGHGHCIAKGARVDRLLAELMGRVDGYGLGRGGSLHVFDPENGNLGTNGIVGGGIPLAAGAALSAKWRGGGDVAVCFFGDGALNQGLFFEVMNMAAIWRLPALFVCENNGYGEFTASEDVTAGRMLARGHVFDIHSETVDGMDVLAVQAATQRAVARARCGEGPSFLICTTYRYSGHHAGDKQDYKDAEEAKSWQQKDPILRLARQLERADPANADRIASLAAEVEAEVDAAVEFARASALPGPEQLVVHLHG